MSIEKSVRDVLLDVASVADENISYGVVKESATFPNITFEIISKEPMSIGTDHLHKMVIEVRTADYNAQSVATIYEQVEQAFENSIGETFDDYTFDVLINASSIIQSPSIGPGDEAEPFVATTVVEILYKYSVS